MTDSLIFLHGGHSRRCIATVDKHFNYHTVQLMTRGTVELFYDDRRTEMNGVWMWPCYPGPLVRFHEWPRGKPWEHRYVAFTGFRVAQWESQGLWLTGPQEITSPNRARRLVTWFEELHATFQQPGLWERQTAVNLLERILIDLARHRREKNELDRPEWLAGVMNRLADFDGDEPDYHELADKHGMSLTTLRRRFRELTGLSPHDYRLDCRVTAAKQLLGDTAMPIKQIAQQLGYRDVFYFSRQFSQRARTSPAAYRKSRQL